MSSSLPAGSSRSPLFIQPAAKLADSIFVLKRSADFSAPFVLDDEHFNISFVFSAGIKRFVRIRFNIFLSMISARLRGKSYENVQTEIQGPVVCV